MQNDPFECTLNNLIFMFINLVLKLLNLEIISTTLYTASILIHNNLSVIRIPKVTKSN